MEETSKSRKRKNPDSPPKRRLKKTKDLLEPVVSETIVEEKVEPKQNLKKSKPQPVQSGFITSFFMKKDEEINKKINKEEESYVKKEPVQKFSPLKKDSIELDEIKSEKTLPIEDYEEDIFDKLNSIKMEIPTKSPIKKKQNESEKSNHLSKSPIKKPKNLVPIKSPPKKIESPRKLIKSPIQKNNVSDNKKANKKNSVVKNLEGFLFNIDSIVGVKFVFSGELDSCKREQAEDLVLSLGG